MAVVDTKGIKRRRSGELDKAFAEIRGGIVVLAIFSFAINLLLLASPLYMLQVYDRVLVSGRIETLIMLTLLVGGALLCLGLLDTMRANLMVRMGGWLNARLGPMLLSTSIRAKLMGDTSGGQALRDLSQVQNFVASQGLTMFLDAPWSPIFLLLIWMLHPLLGMLAVAATVLLLGLSLLNELLTRNLTLSAASAGIATQMHADTAIRNAEVVRAMGMLPALTERWNTGNQASLDATRLAAERGALVVGISKFLRFFVQSSILGLGAYLLLSGNVSGGAMIASSILLGRALAPVEQAMGSWRNFVAARAAYDRLKTRLEQIPQEPDRIRLPEPYGNLSLNRVTYAPPGSRAPILDNVTMRVIPGEAVAVIGPSAGGKSTLCRVLTGVTIPTAGEVRLDGSELFHWDPVQIGAHIGYLPQDVELFPGSVRENIARMGEVDDGKVIRAALLSHAHEFIQALPQGYDTPIGDGGSRLSGGQRQLIGLARAVYGDPRVIVLDEPNASLDQAGEAALAAAVNKLKADGVALVIVGHRPSTLACADRVVFLRGGRIELQGARDEVLQRLRQAAGDPTARPPINNPPTRVVTEPILAE